MRSLFLTVAAFMLVACGRIPLQQPEAPPNAKPSWDAVYASNCAGCHGADGAHGAARPMADPAYLATITRQQLIQVIGDGQGTLMPGFAAGHGGPLSDEEIASLVDGMCTSWGKAGTAASVAWSGAGSAGVAAAGQATYEAFCMSCHGKPDGRSAGSSGSVTDGNYLRLVSDQAIRSAVVFGRSDLGAGCNGPYAGQPASRRLGSQEVADVVAYLSSRRPDLGRSTR